jgi:hypothetical protein
MCVGSYLDRSETGQSLNCKLTNCRGNGKRQPSRGATSIALGFVPRPSIFLDVEFDPKLVLAVEPLSNLSEPFSS